MKSHCLSPKAVLQGAGEGGAPTAGATARWPCRGSIPQRGQYQGYSPEGHFSPLLWVSSNLNHDAVEKWKSIRQEGREDLSKHESLEAVAHPFLDRWEQKHTWRSSHPPGSALENPWLWLVKRLVGQSESSVPKIWGREEPSAAFSQGFCTSCWRNITRAANDSGGMGL